LNDRERLSHELVDDVGAEAAIEVGVEDPISDPPNRVG